MKSASRRSVQSAAQQCCTPTHRSTPRPPHAPPAVQKPPQGLAYNATLPAGYTDKPLPNANIERDRKIMTLRREDMGEGMAPATGTGKRLRTAHFHDGIPTMESPKEIVREQPRSSPKKPRRPLPMHVQPRPWDPRPQS